MENKAAFTLIYSYAAFFLEYRCPFSSVRSLSKIAIPQNTCANRAGVQILSVKEICGGFCEAGHVFCWAAEVAVVSCADVYLQAKVWQLWGKASAQGGGCCWGRCQLGVTLPSLALLPLLNAESRKPLIRATSFLCAVQAGTDVVTHTHRDSTASPKPGLIHVGNTVLVQTLRNSLSFYVLIWRRCFLIWRKSKSTAHTIFTEHRFQCRRCFLFIAWVPQHDTGNNLWFFLFLFQKISSQWGDTWWCYKALMGPVLLYLNILTL